MTPVLSTVTRCLRGVDSIGPSVPPHPSPPAPRLPTHTCPCRSRYVRSRRQCGQVDESTRTVECYGSSRVRGWGPDVGQFGYQTILVYPEDLNPPESVTPDLWDPKVENPLGQTEVR